MVWPDYGNWSHTTLDAGQINMHVDGLMRISVSLVNTAVPAYGTIQFKNCFIWLYSPLHKSFCLRLLLDPLTASCTPSCLHSVHVIIVGYRLQRMLPSRYDVQLFYLPQILQNIVMLISVANVQIVPAHLQWFTLFSTFFSTPTFTHIFNSAV